MVISLQLVADEEKVARRLPRCVDRDTWVHRGCRVCGEDYVGGGDGDEADEECDEG